MIIHDNYNEAIVEGELLLFHTLWNTTNDNMFIVRRNKNGEYINEKTNNALKKIFNLNSEDGQSLKEILNEKDYKHISEKYGKCIDANKALSYEESLFVNKTEKLFWNTIIIPVIDKENDCIRIFGIARDITELKRLNENLDLEVKKRTQELENALLDIKKMSERDKLTGLYNRHYTDSILEDMQKMSQRYDTKCGLILIDIDDFKRVNDTYGHPIGDCVLKEFSSLLNKTIRETDTLGRWGGEEFLLVVPNATKEAVLSLSDKLREKIEQYNFTSVKNITASFGVSLLKKDEDIASLVIRTDKALYKAKSNGKNRVEFI